MRPNTKKRKNRLPSISKISEKQIETSILDYLNLLPKCYCVKVNNTGIYDPTRKIMRKLVGRHTPKGVSDIIGSYKGTAIFIEVKTPKTIKKATQEQLAFLEAMASTGAIAFIADSVETVYNELKKYD